MVRGADFEGSRSLKSKTSLPMMTHKTLSQDSKNMFREMDGDSNLDSQRLEGRNKKAGKVVG